MFRAPLIDPQFADAMAYWFDITEVSIGDPIQSCRDASPGANVTQAKNPCFESGGFDQFEHVASVNCGFHSVNGNLAVQSALRHW